MGQVIVDSTVVAAPEDIDDCSAMGLHCLANLVEDKAEAVDCMDQALADIEILL